MNGDDKRDHLGRRTVIVGGAAVLATGAAVTLLGDNQASAWAKPVVKVAIGAPLAAASEPPKPPAEFTLTVVRPPAVNDTVVSGQVILKNDTDQTANNIVGYLRPTGPEFAIVGIQSVGAFPLAISGSTFTSPAPFPPGSEAGLIVDYAYTDVYEQKLTYGMVNLSVKADAPFRPTGDIIEIWHEQEVYDPPLLTNYYKPYIVYSTQVRRPGSVLEGFAQYTYVYPKPDRMEFTWLRDLQPIPGAKEINYTATAEDVGHLISFAVAYEKVGYTTTRSHSEGVSISPAVPW